MGVGGSYFVDDGLVVLDADVESLGDVASGRRRGGLCGNGDGGGEFGVPIDIWFGLCGLGRRGWLTLGFGEVETFEIKVETAFLQFEMLAPTIFICLLFLEFIEIVERAAIRAGGGGAVAVEKLHFVVVAVDPIGGVELFDMEVGFEIVTGALAAEENPLVVDRAGDDAGGLFAAGCMFGERVFEEFEEVVGVLVVEEESGGGGAVLEMVQAGRGFESLIVYERHGEWFLSVP